MNYYLATFMCGESGWGTWAGEIDSACLEEEEIKAAIVMQIRKDFLIPTSKNISLGRFVEAV